MHASVSFREQIHVQLFLRDFLSLIPLVVPNRGGRKRMRLEHLLASHCAVNTGWLYCADPSKSHVLFNSHHCIQWHCLLAVVVLNAGASLRADLRLQGLVHHCSAKGVLTILTLRIVPLRWVMADPCRGWLQWQIDSLYVWLKGAFSLNLLILYLLHLLQSSFLVFHPLLISVHKVKILKIVLLSSC